MVCLICPWLIWTQLQCDHSSSDMGPSLMCCCAPPITSTTRPSSWVCAAMVTRYVLSYTDSAPHSHSNFLFTTTAASFYSEDSVKIWIFFSTLPCTAHTCDLFSFVVNFFALSHSVGSQPGECFPFVQMAHTSCHVWSVHQEVSKPLTCRLAWKYNGGKDKEINKKTKLKPRTEKRKLEAPHRDNLYVVIMEGRKILCHCLYSY